MSYLSHNKRQKVCLRRVWIRLTTAYLLCAREVRQNNALALQFWCLSNALTLRVRALDASKSQRAWLFCLNSLAKVNTQLLIYNFLSEQDIGSFFCSFLKREYKSEWPAELYTQKPIVTSSFGGYSNLNWVRMSGPKFQPPPYN